ncbi:hypothetical protein ABPG72_010876 [Tetrahymena utriculariae]
MIYSKSSIILHFAMVFSLNLNNFVRKLISNKQINKQTKNILLFFVSNQIYILSQDYILKEMNQLSNQSIEQEEISQTSNISTESQNIINISQDQEREEINIEDQCFNSIDFQVRKGHKDSSIDLESIQNQDTDQQKLIEILQNQQYFELNKQNLKQQLYSVNCFIPEDELENDFSSSEKLEEDSQKQNKSIISELTQISLNELAQSNSKEVEIQEENKSKKVDFCQKQQNAEVQKEIECYQQSDEQICKQDLLKEIKDLLDDNDYARNKPQVEKMTRLLAEIPYFQQILTNDGYKNEDILNVCQCLQTQHVEQNNFLFHINDPSEYLYILLEGYMAVFVPKSDNDVQQEIDINYNIVLNEKLLNKIQTTNHMHQAKQEATNKLELLYKQRELHFNKNHEEFLKIASNNSQKYYNQDQQKCRYRRARVLKPGDVFGHTALAIKKDRTASVIAMNNCILAKIHVILSIIPSLFNNFQISKNTQNQFYKTETSICKDQIRNIKLIFVHFLLYLFKIARITELKQITNHKLLSFILFKPQKQLFQNFYIFLMAHFQG